MKSTAAEQADRAEDRPVFDKDRLVEKVGEVRERARELAERGKDRAVELEGEFEDYVREHPVQSVALAAGVGALAGFAAGLVIGRR